MIGDIQENMIAPNPIPAGSRLDGERAAKKPNRSPRLPAAWTATVLLSPFGDSVRVHFCDC